MITKVAKVGGDFGEDNFIFSYSFKLNIKVQEGYKELLYTLYQIRPLSASPAVYILLPLLNHSLAYIISIYVHCFSKPFEKLGDIIPYTANSFQDIFSKTKDSLTYNQEQ